jgi:hypothetical protein
MTINIKHLNAEILQQYDRYTEDKFKDIQLMSSYITSPSMKNGVLKKLDEVQKELKLDERQTRMFMKKMLPLVIPPGVKANIRGQVFNKYIKNILCNFAKGKKVTVEFEKKVSDMSEIADWVMHLEGGRTIIGYNQLDIWNGGAQINRGGKYVLDEGLHRRLKKKNTFIVCIVARKLILKGSESKLARIINVGLRHNILMWPKGLKTYINQMYKCSSKMSVGGKK